VVLVGAAAPVDRPVIAKGRAPVLDPGSQNLDYGRVKASGSGPGYSPCRRVDARPPQGLVGVDVADAGDRALR